MKNKVKPFNGRKRRGWIKIVCIVLVVAVLATGGLYALGVIGKAKSTSETTFKVEDLKSGSLQKTISATGSLSAGGSGDVAAPVDLKIKDYQVDAGQSIKKGDVIATIDTAYLDTVITTLRKDISNLDNTIANMYSSYSSTGTINSPYEGRVKKIIAEVDSDIKATVTQSGALLILSGDGKMKTEAAITAEVKAGDAVTVKAGDTSYDGTVVSVSADGKTAVITFSDNGPELDADVTVLNSDGTQIGSGKAAINNPLSVIADGGTISKVYASLNQKVYKGTNLFYAKNIPLSENYNAQVASREEKLSQLSEAMKLQSAGVITSTLDGIVESVGGASSGGQNNNAASSDTVTAGSALVSLYTDGAVSLTVSVDELDIGSVKKDQTATVTLDAVSGKTFSGKVTKVSEIGNNNSGVTTYSVQITLDPNDALRIGMNASAVIVIEEHTNVLMVPLTAIQYSQGKQYVWLYTGELPEDKTKDPGVKTEITTGLSNSQYAEISSGLKAGDQVVVVRTVSTNSVTGANNGVNNMPGGMMGGGGPEFIQGGQGNPGGGRVIQRAN